MDWRRVLVLLLWLAARPATAATAEAQGGEVVMGTLLQMRVRAATATDAEAALRGAFAVVRHWEDVLTTWRPEGELARFNASAGQGAVPISADLDRGLAAMLHYAEATQGAFHPGAGRLIVAARTPGSGVKLGDGLPPLGEIVERGDGVAQLRAGYALDAGAVGKGLGLDAAAGTLRAAGAEAFFLDFGGSSQLAWTARATAPGWRLIVAGLAEGEVHGTVELRRGSLSTSRSGRPGDAAGPILDPRTGEVVMARRLVTVWGEDATRADAWSTALVVRGREGIEAARRAGLEVLVQDEAGTVTTAGFWQENFAADLDSSFQNR